MRRVGKFMSIRFAIGQRHILHNFEQPRGEEVVAPTPHLVYELTGHGQAGGKLLQFLRLLNQRNPNAIYQLPDIPSTLVI